MSRKWLAMLTAVLALPLLIAGGAANAQSGEPIRIPFGTAFEGAFADYAAKIWDTSIVPAVKKVNEMGGIHGRPVEYYKVAVPYPEVLGWATEFRRLASDPNVIVFHGPDLTKAHFATFDLIEEHKIPVFNSGSGGHWTLPSFGSWSFRYLPMAADVMPVLYKKAKERFGFKTAAIVYSNDDDSTVQNGRIFRKSLEDLGVKIVAEHSYKSKETNFSSIVVALRAANPDIVSISASLPTDAGTFVKQLRERGVNARIISDNFINAVDYWKLSEGRAEGTLTFGLWSPEDERPMVQEWIKTWREYSGEADNFPDNYMTGAYDSVLVLAQVMNAAEELTRESIRDAFSKVKLDTISGTVQWNGPGDVKRAVPQLMIWTDGKVLPWK